jgi:hypothetical protein
LKVMEVVGFALREDGGFNAEGVDADWD